MGAVFFFIFMALLFFVALFFIILNTIFILIWKARKRRGKTPKKRWLVIPTVFLVVNIIMALIPVGFIGFLRIVNSAYTPEVVYAESGIVLYWPLEENGSTTKWFEMDGIKYVEFSRRPSDEHFWLNYRADRLDAPIANIRYDPSDSTAFNDSMYILLSGSTHSEQDIATVYPVINDNGFALYHVRKSSPDAIDSTTLLGGAYCPESELESVRDYYADIANYDTQDIVCKYAVYTDSEQWWGKRHDAHYIYIEETARLDPGVFERLRQVYDGEQEPVRIEIPQKYKDIDEAAIPGTPILGYDERELQAYSKDGLALREVNLELIDGRVYVDAGSRDGYPLGYPVPDDMNQYLLDTIFNP
jgi:hypothetical protein